MTVAMLNTCWKQIGIWGDRTCPELKVHTHCRNCPVYHNAAAALLDREPPPDYQADWTMLIAQPRKSKLAGDKSVVIFRIGAEWLALPTTVFQEVTDQRPIHPLPHRQGRVVQGLVNIRGQLLVCVSLAELLGLENSAEPKKQKSHGAMPRLLVTAHKSGGVVFPTQEVHVGHRYHPDELKPLPATVSLAAARHATGLLAWRDHNVGVLDDEFLFYTLNRSLT
jgi:chemotaxis-related protein WspD